MLIIKQMTPSDTPTLIIRLIHHCKSMLPKRLLIISRLYIYTDSKNLTKHCNVCAWTNSFTVSQNVFWGKPCCLLLSCIAAHNAELVLKLVYGQRECQCYCSKNQKHSGMISARSMLTFCSTADGSETNTGYYTLRR